MMKATKTERVPIMFDHALLTEIDDHRFANRIASRGDAIRRLVRRGLEVEKDVGHQLTRAQARN